MLKDGKIMPFTVNELKKLLNQLPEDAKVSYRFNGEIEWDSEDNTLYINENL